MARNTNSRGFSLKDELFNKKKIAALAERFGAVHSDFNSHRFVSTIMRTLPALELKERIGSIASALEAELPTDFAAACDVIVAALPEPLDPTKTDDDFGDFIYAPLGLYVARHGATAQNLQKALPTLRELTMRFSMEDAIRTFLITFPEETLATLEVWSEDKNYHVRRLVSEGTRPRLPWSSRVELDQKKVMQLLTRLHSDKTRYVVRSVANHLNDIAKDDPTVVIATLKHWHTQNLQDTKELAWLTKHALRTLIKQGNPDALALIGFKANPKITVSALSITPKKIQLDETVTFSFSITAEEDCDLIIDYRIDFQKAGGKTAERVFKLKTVSLAQGESVEIHKSHRFPKAATTLTFYPGVHSITLQINGRRFTSASFNISG